MNAPNKSGWKPSAPLAGDTESATFTGNRALMLEEPLIFEIGHIETTGVDLPEPQADAPSRLGGLERTDTIGLPGLSEPECVRHYTRLSRQNYAIDLGLFPLGSCTMKHGCPALPTSTRCSRSIRCAARSKSSASWPTG